MIVRLFITLMAISLLTPILSCKDQPTSQPQLSQPKLETTSVTSSEQGRIDLPILKTWSGNFPVDQLSLLPAGRQETSVGYIDDADTLAAMWKHFMPDEPLPEVNFGKNIVVFYRNVQFYNRTDILKVELENGTAEIMAMETRSAMPIEDKVAMAIAIIPRKGIKAIKGRDEECIIVDC